MSRPEVTIHHLTLYPEESAETGIPAGERELPWHRDPHLGDTARTVRIEARDDREGSQKHDAYWSQHYLAYLTKRPDNVVAALRAIAGSPGAVIVHCAAGKDRTGTVIGLALKLAGATDDAVVADFEASAQRVPQILARLAGRPAYSANLDGKTVQQQSPRAETMRMMLDVLDRDHGGVEGWLTTQGWTSDETALLRAKLRD